MLFERLERGVARTWLSKHQLDRLDEQERLEYECQRARSPHPPRAEAATCRALETPGQEET
jgi:hypothetical protein